MSLLESDFGLSGIITASGKVGGSFSFPENKESSQARRKVTTQADAQLLDHSATCRWQQSMFDI